MIDNKFLDQFKSSEESLAVCYSDSPGQLFVYAKYDDFFDDEIQLIKEAEFQWKVVRIAHTAYLCFSPIGYSWNEIELNIADRNQNLRALTDYSEPTLPMCFTAIYQTSGEIIGERKFVLEARQVEQLKNSLAAQREVNYKKISDLDALGDPGVLIKSLQSASDDVEIVSVETDYAEQTTTLRVNMMPKREFKEPRARWILRHFENLSKDEIRVATQIVEEIAETSEYPGWSHCLVPRQIFERIREIKNTAELTRQLEAMNLAHLVPEYLDNLKNGDYPNIYAALMYNWRYSKGIYDFDEEFLKTIYLASLPLKLSPEVFTRLPEYCVYVKTPGMTDWRNQPVQGFFAMVEKTSETADGQISVETDDDKAAEEVMDFTSLYILFDISPSDASSAGMPELLRMPLDEETLADCLDWLEVVEPRSGEQPDFELLIEWIAPFLNQLLYLCSEQPEIEKGRGGDKTAPGTETVKKTRHGLRLYAPTIATEWLCGWRTGKFLKGTKGTAKNKTGASGEPPKTVRSHLRRAHWHTYYIGKRDLPEREIKIRWLSMIKVNFGDDQDISQLPVVIKRVDQ